MKITLQQMRYMLKIAETGSMVAASRVLSVSQPSLSEAVSVVERELGFSLFTRGNTGATPTKEGMEFLGRARQVVLQMDNLERRYGGNQPEGMRFAARMGMRLADMPVELAQAQGQLLDDLGLPELGWEASPAQVLDVMKRDKKARHGQVRFVCLHDVGQWRLQDVADGVILEELEAYFAQKRR